MIEIFRIACWFLRAEGKSGIPFRDAIQDFANHTIARGIIARLA
jgi:hypothetical protein